MPDSDVLLDKGGAVYNVEAYGATGDGTTDDTASIQAAIEACQDGGGGIVYFPAGTFRVTGLTVSASNVWLVGAGPASTIANVSATGDTLLLSPEAQPTGCGVRQLRFAPAVTRTSGNEIAAEHFGVLWLTDLWFENAYRCIKLGAAAQTSFIVFVKNIRAYGYYQFAHLTHVLDFWFDSLSLDAHRADAVSIRLDGGCEGGSFCNGDIVNSVADEGKTGTVLHIKAEAYTATPARWISYSNFLFDSHAEGVLGEDGYGHEFTNCWFSNRPGNGVSLQANAQDYVFSSCVFANNGAQGAIFYGGSGYVVANSYVVANAQASAADGIAIGSAVESTRIQGVHAFNGWGLGGSQSYGIKVYDGAQNVMLLDNHLGTANKLNQVGGIRIEPTADYLIVKNNIARGYAPGEGISNGTSAAPSRIVADNLV